MHSTDMLADTQTCLSGSCEEPETILQYDCFFSEEGAYLTNYGVEGMHKLLNFIPAMILTVMAVRIDTPQKHGRNTVFLT